MIKISDIDYLISRDRDVGEFIRLSVNLMEIEEIKELYEYVIRKLGGIQSEINYWKKFRLDSLAQSNIIILNDEKERYYIIKEKIEKRLKNGW